MYDQLFVYNEQNRSNFSDRANQIECSPMTCSSKWLLRKTEIKNEKKLIE